MDVLDHWQIICTIICTIATTISAKTILSIFEILLDDKPAGREPDSSVNRAMINYCVWFIPVHALKADVASVPREPRILPSRKFRRFSSFEMEQLRSTECGGL